MLEQDGRFALDAQSAGGIQLLQEFQTVPLSRRLLGGHKAAGGGLRGGRDGLVNVVTSQDVEKFACMSSTYGVGNRSDKLIECTCTYDYFSGDKTES